MGLVNFLQDAPRADAYVGVMSVDLEPRDVVGALRDLSVLVVTRTTTDEEAMAAIRPLGELNQCQLGVVRFVGETPWEVHPDGDELLYVVEGAVDVTVLTDAGPVERHVATGELFVVPRGAWHRQHARERVALLFATAAGTTASSWRRTRGRRTGRRRRARVDSTPRPAARSDSQSGSRRTA